MSPKPKTTQSMAALNEANRIRIARARLKDDIREGVVSLPEVLLSEFPEWLEGMTVGKLLQAAHRLGPSRCRVLLREAGFQSHPITENWYVGHLTERQRWTLAELVCEGRAVERAAA